MVAKYGRDLWRETCRDLMDYSERRMRAEIAQFPDGRYHFEDTVENDGIEDKPYQLRVDVFVQGDELIADFSGTDDQAKGPINATLGVTWSATYNALFHMTDPSIPKNSGCFRPIKIVPSGNRRQCQLSGARGGGQHGDPPQARADRDRRAGPGHARTRDGGGERHRRQFVFGGHHPDYDEYFAATT